ncbi:MAG: glucosamine-6-phosphate deaminase [Limisphaerales bacterium]
MNTLSSSLQSFSVEALPVRVYADPADLYRDAAGIAQKCLQEALAARGSAAAILATGNSQLIFLDELVRIGGVDWPKIILFHMDEYLGLDANHRASFRRYMRERVESRVHPREFHYLAGDALEPLDECERYAKLLRAQPIDLCCLGIGENGHIAFNDPAVAKFNDPHFVKIVKLDDVCKMQQVKQEHFPNLESVNPYALTLTIPALCSAKKMLCLAPEKRKAEPIKNMLKGPISADCPASILRTQAQAILFLDQDSASLL